MKEALHSSWFCVVPMSESLSMHLVCWPQKLVMRSAVANVEGEASLMRETKYFLQSTLEVQSNPAHPCPVGFCITHVWCEPSARRSPSFRICTRRVSTCSAALAAAVCIRLLARLHVLKWDEHG